ncbi:MAG: hypothetical protein DME33_03585 [Verrucomicrobia bacterium]|nr:MAG: hypothetical protein DME33_03585 [Verrucomicrobiota bacterium]
MVRWAHHFRRAISSFLSPSRSSRLLRSTTPSFTPWRTKKNGWITISKSRGTFSGFCSHQKRRRSTGFRSAALMCRPAVAIADVSGKGVPASLIMAICRSVLRAEAARNPSPADVLRKVNRQLYPDIREDMFISMAYLILDHQRNGVVLARAGHDAPLLYKQQSQSVTPVKPPGMVVGIDSGNVFDRLTVDFGVLLERDDCLVLYTDGVTETLNTEGDEFGLERMMQSVRARANDGAQAIVKKIIEDVRDFTGSEPQNDDITVIAIRKT